MEMSVFPFWNVSIGFHPRGDLSSAFWNRKIKNFISWDVTKEITERVPGRTLITQIFFLGRRFLVGRGVERDV